MCKKEYLFCFLVISNVAFSVGNYLGNSNSETVLCSKDDLVARVNWSKKILSAAYKKDYVEAYDEWQERLKSN
jgi:hypothetical protein